MSALSGDVANPGTYNDDTRKLVARGRRITSSSTTTTEQSVLQIEGVLVKSGRSYWICTTDLALSSSVANDIVRAYVRYTADGTTATTSSSIIPGGHTQSMVGSTTQSENSRIGTPYFPSADETLSLLLTVTRAVGTGNSSIFADATFVIDLLIYDTGPDTGNVGISL